MGTREGEKTGGRGHRKGGRMKEGRKWVETGEKNGKGRGGKIWPNSHF